MLLIVRVNILIKVRSNKNKLNQILDTGTMSNRLRPYPINSLQRREIFEQPSYLKLRTVGMFSSPYKGRVTK